MFSLFSFFKFLFPTCLVVKLAESATFLERGTVTSLGMSFVVSFVVPQGLWPRPWILAAWSMVMWWSSKRAQVAPAVRPWPLYVAAVLYLWRRPETSSTKGMELGHVDMLQ